jgi:RNA polymerase sigma-70 factor, ECF subfamily
MLNEVTNEIRDKLVQYVRRVSPPYLSDQRDDLVQMAAIKLMRTASEMDWTDGFLSRVAYSVVIDEIRRRRRRNEVGMSPSLPDRIANSADLSPEANARGAQVGNAMLDCLQSLTGERKRAVTLYLQDHPVPEIAERMGCDKKKASNLVYRGLSELRDALRKAGIEP